MSEGQNFVRSVKGSVPIAALLAIVGLSKLSDQLQTAFPDPLIADAIVLLLLLVVVGIAFRNTVPPFLSDLRETRKNYSSVNPWGRAVATRWKSILLNGLIVLPMLAISWSNVSALAAHVTPPWEAEALCFRTPQQCRSCVSFKDRSGRVLAPRCQAFSDQLGLINVTPERWLSYRPHSIALTCGSASVELDVQEIWKGKRCATLDVSY